MSDIIPVESIPIAPGAIEAECGEVGYDSKYLGYLDAHFLNLISRRKIQCASYVLARRGKVFASKAMGFLRPDTDIPFRTDSPRQIASITKLFTAIALLRLYELGKLDLNESVSRYVPEFATDMHSPITVFQLLTHTGGVVGDSGYFLEPYPFENPLMQGKEWLKRGLAGPLQAAPGSQWIYSSFGFMVLGKALEAITGEDFEDHITRTILKPLGMSRSAFRPSLEKSGEICVASAEEAAFLPKILDPRPWPGPPRSSWGIFSTAEDLSRLGRCLAGGGELDGVRILGRKTVEAMGRNQIPGTYAFYWGARKAEYPYGLGVQIAKNEFTGKGGFAHEGAGASCLTLDPEREFASAFFVPSKGGWTAEAVDNPNPIIWGGLCEDPCRGRYRPAPSRASS